jgi:asparagine synthase (glutamine-hydrolysing)
MSTTDGRFCITFNGEIYNYQELRQKLILEGIQFHSHTDTEVILHLYEREGPDCLKQLAGMFAFAIWDAREETCFIARDPLGVKPLYFFQQRTTLIFASEVRALLASGKVERRISPQSLNHYLISGSLPDPYSLIDGVCHLPAGHHLLWKGGKLEMKRFWRMHFDPREENVPRAAALTRSALLDSLRRHFISDVPVGIFLSGGLDSTVLVALAQQFDFKELKTFSISFDNPRLNEGDAARHTAEYFGATHFEWRLDALTCRGLFEKFLDKMDQPSIDGFNTFCASKHAYNHDMKVVLSGLGGDELFGGYRSFLDVPRIYALSRWLEPVAPLRAATGQALERYASRASIRRLGAYLRKSPTMARSYATYRGIFTEDEAIKLVRHFMGAELVESEYPDTGFLLDPSVKDEISRLEVENYMCFQLLRDSDTMSMAWGLELRVPFVDRKLIESISTIPAAQRLAAKKGLLRQAVPEIPDWIMKRPKQGFAFPFEDWFAAEWSPLLQKVGAGSGVRVQTWYQKWSLLILHRWCDNLQVPLLGAAP